jgi:hypothetical protein
MAYRVIACSVGDYDSDISLDEILALDEFDQDYFLIHAFDEFSEAKEYAARVCGEWLEADMNEADGFQLETYIGRIADVMAAVARFDDKEILSTGSTDWIRIEEVENAD